MSYRYCFFFVIVFFREISLDISCELYTWQMIHMKCQNLLSMKDDNERPLVMKFHTVMNSILLLAGFNPGPHDLKLGGLTIQPPRGFFLH